MAKELFGTDGIRGVPGTAPLDDATLYATGRSLGNYLKQTNPAARVLLGMDTRESGPHIAALLAAGLANAGTSVDFAGVITTPGVACLVRQRGFQAGVVISASHNPFHDNGVKLFSNAGMKFPDAVEEMLEEDIFKHRHEAPPKNVPPLVADEALDAKYLEFLRSRVIPGAKLSSLRMVLDCANGAAYKLGPELFGSLGAHVIAMGVEPDGRNINADCGSLHLEGLQKRVVAERAAIGVAFDGDADRALFVCQSGRVINGDGVLLAAARHLRSAGKLKGNRVVATSMSNLGLERVLAREGIELARAAVGDRYVLEEMLRSNNVLGGEQSGHIIFLDDSPAGDGLLTALKVASLVSMNGRLESLVSGLKDYPQTIVNVRVKTKPPLESLPEVSRALAEAKSALGENGRVVLRYSGTEPLARVMVEAEDDTDVQRYSQSLAEALRASIGA
ncbi:MAG TPA: phosphoglucosamine mutase [Candidatus Saccharimonadales bacterium]|jgi:phosphoglucosamine mutase|nr:phosphoglucosamine mutase [Candidatus Saccharimonadales bacterium]